MGFLPYNRPILYNTHSLNVSLSVSTLRAWLHPTPQHTQVLPPHDTHSHTHTHIHKPLAPSLPSRSFGGLWHRLPRWHQSAPLAWWPSHHLVRSPWLAPAPYWECFVWAVCIYVCVCVWVCVCVCVWECLSGASPNILAPRHRPPTTWRPGCLFSPVFPLHSSPPFFKIIPSFSLKQKLLKSYTGERTYTILHAKHISLYVCACCVRGYVTIQRAAICFTPALVLAARP